MRRRREIHLRSGTWTWRVEEDGPGGGGGDVRNGRVASTVSLLVLQDPQVAENRMEVRIPRHLGEPGNQAAVEALARHPDRRDLMGGEGELWTFRKRGDGDRTPAPIPAPPREVEASREGEAPVTVMLPENRGLGEVTDEELMDLVR